MTPAEIWPMIAGAAVVVFGAGRFSAIVMNGRHVTKEFCSLQHEKTDERLHEIQEGVKEIRAWINKNGVG